nr:hypothetical protein CFP56_00141 [Quercus suber]
MQQELPFHSTSIGPSSAINPPHVQAEQAIRLPAMAKGWVTIMLVDMNVRWEVGMGMLMKGLMAGTHDHLVAFRVVLPVELTLDVQNVIAPPKEKSKSASNEKASTVESPTAASPKADVKVEKPQAMDEQAVENGSAYNRREDESAKSVPSSPFVRSAVESPPREFPDSNFHKAHSADASPSNKDYQRTGSPQAGGLFQKKSTFAFDESVPSTPLYGSSNSPHKYEGSGPAFYGFSRFDSFSTHDSGYFAPRESQTLARFDSVLTSRDSDEGHGFPTFEDSDLFGSEPFGTSIDSQPASQPARKPFLSYWNAF